MNNKTDSLPLKKGRRKHKNDLILITALLLFGILAVSALFIMRDIGQSVTVTVDGKAYGSYPLSEDVKVDIASGEFGDKHNTLVISAGQAYVSDADCPGHDCVASRPISYEGETIICTPNRVVVAIE